MVINILNLKSIDFNLNFNKDYFFINWNSMNWLESEWLEIDLIPISYLIES